MNLFCTAEFVKNIGFSAKDHLLNGYFIYLKSSSNHSLNNFVKGSNLECFLTNRFGIKINFDIIPQTILK